MPSITIGIPTFRRPRGLERLLGALATLLTWSLAVKIIDDLSENVSALQVQAAVCVQEERRPRHDPLVNAQTGEDDGVSLLEEGLADLDGTPLEAVGTDGGEHVRAFRGLHDGGSGDRQDFARLAWQLEPPHFTRV